MMWQDLVFLAGSALSITFLAPTLRDASARVPLGTSLPSMGIGGVYGITFASLGMTFSAFGAVTAGVMWALIALVRSPQPDSLTMTRRENLVLFVHDVRWWVRRQTHRLPGNARTVRYSRRVVSRVVPSPFHFARGGLGFGRR